MFDFLNPLKFGAIVGPILLISMACFCVVYVALLGFTAMNLPFGREIALAWLTGSTLRSLVITVEQVLALLEAVTAA